MLTLTTGNGAEALLWAQLECTIGILAACLPTLNVLVIRFMPTKQEQPVLQTLSSSYWQAFDARSISSKPRHARTNSSDTSFTRPESQEGLVGVDSEKDDSDVKSLWSINFHSIQRDLNRNSRPKSWQSSAKSLRSIRPKKGWRVPIELPKIELPDFNLSQKMLQIRQDWTARIKSEGTSPPPSSGLDETRPPSYNSQRSAGVASAPPMPVPILRKPLPSSLRPSRSNGDSPTISPVVRKAVGSGVRFNLPDASDDGQSRNSSQPSLNSTSDRSSASIMGEELQTPADILSDHHVQTAPTSSPGVTDFQLALSKLPSAIPEPYKGESHDASEVASVAPSMARSYSRRASSRYSFVSTAYSAYSAWSEAASDGAFSIPLIAEASVVRYPQGGRAKLSEMVIPPVPQIPASFEGSQHDNGKGDQIPPPPPKN
jgi:hypothetical protein